MLKFRTTACGSFLTVGLLLSFAPVAEPDVSPPQTAHSTIHLPAWCDAPEKPVEIDMLAVATGGIQYEDRVTDHVQTVSPLDDNRIMVRVPLSLHGLGTSLDLDHESIQVAGGRFRAWQIPRDPSFKVSPIDLTVQRPDGLKDTIHEQPRIPELTDCVSIESSGGLSFIFNPLAIEATLDMREGYGLLGHDGPFLLPPLAPPRLAKDMVLYFADNQLHSAGRKYKYFFPGYKPPSNWKKAPTKDSTLAVVVDLFAEQRVREQQEKHDFDAASRDQDLLKAKLEQARKLPVLITSQTKTAFAWFEARQFTGHRTISESGEPELTLPTDEMAALYGPVHSLISSDAYSKRPSSKSVLPTDAAKSLIAFCSDNHPLKLRLIAKLLDTRLSLYSGLPADDGATRLLIDYVLATTDQPAKQTILKRLASLPQTSEIHNLLEHAGAHFD